MARAHRSLVQNLEEDKESGIVFEQSTPMTKISMESGRRFQALSINFSRCFRHLVLTLLLVLPTALSVQASQCEISVGEAASPKTNKVRREIFEALFEDHPIVFSKRFLELLSREILSKNHVRLPGGERFFSTDKFFTQKDLKDVVLDSFADRQELIYALHEKYPEVRNFNDQKIRELLQESPEIEWTDRSTEIAQKTWQRIQEDFTTLGEAPLRKFYGKKLTDQEIGRIRETLKRFSNSPTHEKEIVAMFRESLLDQLKAVWWRATGNRWSFNMFVPQLGVFLLGLLPFAAFVEDGMGIPLQGFGVFTVAMASWLALQPLPILSVQGLTKSISNIKYALFKRRLRRSIFAGDKRSSKQRQEDRKRAGEIHEKESQAEELFDRIQLDELTREISELDSHQILNIVEPLARAAMALGLRAELIELKNANPTDTLSELRHVSKEFDRLSKKQSVEAKVQRAHLLLRHATLLKDRAQEVLKPKKDFEDLGLDIDFLIEKMGAVQSRITQLVKAHSEQSAELSSLLHQLEISMNLLEVQKEAVQGRQQMIVELIEAIHGQHTKILSHLVADKAPTDLKLVDEIEELNEALSVEP